MWLDPGYLKAHQTQTLALNSARSGLAPGGFWIPVRWQSLHESRVELQEGRRLCMLFFAHVSKAEENAWLQLANSVCVERYPCRI